MVKETISFKRVEGGGGGRGEQFNLVGNYNLSKRLYQITALSLLLDEFQNLMRAVYTIIYQ